MAPEKPLNTELEIGQDGPFRGPISPPYDKLTKSPNRISRNPVDGTCDNVTNRIIIVTGQPRSGTSLMMRLLHESGIPVFADEEISYETRLSEELENGNTEWLSGLEPGTAVKILTPHVFYIPLTLSPTFIWMRRNAKQQAKSQQRFLSESRAWRDARIPFIKKVEAMYPVLQVAGPLLRVSFDTLVTRPRDACERVSGFLGAPVDPDSVSVRSPKAVRYDKGELEIMSPWRVG